MTLTPSDHQDIGHRLAVLNRVLIRLRARLGQRYPHKDKIFRVLEKTTNALSPLRSALDNDADATYPALVRVNPRWYFGATDVPDWPELPDRPVAPRRLKPRMTTTERDFVCALLRKHQNIFRAVDALIRLHYDRDSHIDRTAEKCRVFLAKLTETIAAAEVRA